MKASIITIGNEILIGQILDSNSAFIANELNKIGIFVYRILSIPDENEQIITTIDEIIKISDLIIITGGLGPTNDDITKFSLAKYFNTKLVLNNQALKSVKSFLKKRNVTINQRNIKQAELPEKCKLLPNRFGTAYGMWFEKDSTIVISLPGVPIEMKNMMLHYVIPDLKARYKLPEIIHRTILTTGIPESVMADKIANWETNLPHTFKLAYLPSPGILRLRLTASNDEKNLLEKELYIQIKKLEKIIADNIFGFDTDTLQEIVGKLLMKNLETVSIAESCTGGKISSLIASIPGSSKYFIGGIIAYSNFIKQQMLHIDESVIKKNGAVSKPVVVHMAESIRMLYKTDYSVATSGIAGPGGGSTSKPVGTTWIAVASKEKTVAQKFQFGDQREYNINKAAIAALNMLRLFILKKI